MAIFIFFIIFCAICSYIGSVWVDKGLPFLKVKKYYLIISGTVLALIIGLRADTVGTDSMHYSFFWRLSNQINWSQILEYREPFFILLEKIFRATSNDYTIFFLGVAVICVWGVGTLFYRYSEKPFISYVSLLSLSYIYFFMSGLRQSIAIAIIMFSYKYVRERKLIPFLLLVALAYGFHNTAVIFLLAYPIANVKINWKHFTCIGVAYCASIFASSLILTFLFEILSWERLIVYEKATSTLSLSGFIIQFCIMLFCMYYYPKRLKQVPEDLSLYNIMFLGLIFQVFTPIIGEFFRLSMYFSIFNTVLAANAYSAESNKQLQAIVGIGIIGIFILYYLLFSGPNPSIIPYKLANF